MIEPSASPSLCKGLPVSAVPRRRPLGRGCVSSRRCLAPGLETSGRRGLCDGHGSLLRALRHVRQPLHGAAQIVRGKVRILA